MKVRYNSDNYKLLIQIYTSWINLTPILTKFESRHSALTHSFISHRILDRGKIIDLNILIKRMNKIDSIQQSYYAVWFAL